MRWLEPRHLRIINKTVLGGRAIVRDVGLADAALEQTSLARYYKNLDLTHTAAVLASKMMQDHAFVDGNKRMAWATTLVFLFINGVRCVAPSHLRVEMVVGLASKKISVDEFAKFLDEYKQNITTETGTRSRYGRFGTAKI